MLTLAHLCSVCCYCSNRNDFGKALRDNGQNVGPLRATNSFDRLPSHSDRGQQFDQNRGAEAETRSKATTSMADVVDVQRPPPGAARDTTTCPSSNRIPLSTDCIHRSKCPGGDTFVPGSASLYSSDSVKTLTTTDRNCSALQSSLRNRRASYESPARDGGPSQQGLRGKAGIGESSNFYAGDDQGLVEVDPRGGAVHSKTTSDPATTYDLRIASSVSKDVHKKQTLAEYFVKQLSREKPDNLDGHRDRTDRRFSTGSNSSNGGSASSKNSPPSAGTPGHHETFPRNSDRSRQSNCDGFITKKNTLEQPGVKSVNRKTQDTLPGLSRGSHSSRPVSGKSVGQGEEGSVWNTKHYSKETKDVSRLLFSAGSKNDASAKTLANAQHLTGVDSATDSSRHLTGEGKYPKNRIPDTGFQLGPSAVDSPRSLRRYSDEDSKYCQADEQVMSGTNLSESTTKQFQTARSKTDNNIGDQTTVQTTSTVETVYPESSSRTRRKSDMVDIDNLQQMKRYYQTKQKRLEDLKASSSALPVSASEPTPEVDNLSATSLKSSSDWRPGRSAASLPVPWLNEHTEFSCDVKQDPRVSSSKTVPRVISELKLSDPASGSPEEVVAKRRRALSLPLPRFAHWVLSSANEHGARRRMSEEACLLEAKTNCSSGILSPHLSPNPTRSEDSCLGFKLESQSTGRVSIEDCEPGQDDVTLGVTGSQNADQNVMSLSLLVEDKPRDSSPPMERCEETDEVNGTNEVTCRSPHQQISSSGGAGDSLYAMLEKVEEVGDITGLKQVDGVMRTEGDSIPVTTDGEDPAAEASRLTGVLEDQGVSKGSDTKCHSSIPVTDSIQAVEEFPPAESLRRDEVVQSEILLPQQGSVDIIPNTHQPPDILSDALDDSIKDHPSSSCVLPQSDPTLAAAAACAVECMEKEEKASTNSQDQQLESTVAESVVFVKVEEDPIAIVGQNSTDSKAETDAGQRGDSTEKIESEEEKRREPLKREDAKVVREGLGLKRKADVAFQSHEDAPVNPAFVTTPGSETRKERCKVDDGESSSHTKHRKLDDSQSVAAGKRSPTSSAPKQHRKQLEKNHHSSSQTSSGIVSNASSKHSSHSHNKATTTEVRVKKEHHDRPAASDSSRSLGKVPEPAGTATAAKRHHGVREEKERRSANGNDGGDVKSGNSKKSFELSHTTTKKPDHYRDGSKKHSGVAGGCSADKKGSKTSANSVEKTTTETERSFNSTDAKVSKMATVGCDKGRERKVWCDGEQSSKTKHQSSELETDIRARKGLGKVRDNVKLSEKCAKSKDEVKKMAAARVSEGCGDSRQEHHTKKHSTSGHSSTSAKSVNGDERLEYHSHEHSKDSDGNRKGESGDSSSKKLENGPSFSSSVSKLASCPDRKKHSSNDKNLQEPRKTLDPHSRFGSTFENKVRDSDHKTKSNGRALEGKQSLELHKRKLELNGNGGSERTPKIHREPAVELSDEKERKSLDQRIHKSSDAKTSVRTKYEKALTSKSSSDTRTNEKLSVGGSTTKSENSHSRKNSISEKLRDSSSTPTDRSSVAVSKHEGTMSKERSSVEAMQKSQQRHMEKCSSDIAKHRPAKVNRKTTSTGSRSEKDSKPPKDSTETPESSSARKEKSTKRPEEKRELKALLQEQDEEMMLAPYLSMYDMVKRRSNKEREKEQAAKIEQQRSRTLNRLQVCILLFNDTYINIRNE